MYCNSFELINRLFHIVVSLIIILQSSFLGLSVKSDNSNNQGIQEDFTQIKLNKEHAHSEASGIILFNITGETETEITETAVNFLKQIKLYLSHTNSLLSFAFQHNSEEIIKCEHFTYHPSLLHIALFLFNADLRI